MDNLFIKSLQDKIVFWRDGNYEGVQKETLSLLRHIERVGFLHKPQREALETYIYLKEVLDNVSTAEIFRNSFQNEKDLLLGLGLSKDEAFNYFGETEKIQQLIEEKLGKSDYANQVYALTMGAGKTVLMATMMMYDFVLSYYHQTDKRFAKNALVFAPDTTIIESLKEIKSFEYSKILPKEFEHVLLNIKYHYLEDTKTQLTPIGNYNVIVSNSHKIILKTKREKNDLGGLFADIKYKSQREIENNRLLTIRSLENLAIFVDEAHHSYGTNLEGALKKLKQTIDYIHEKKPLVGVVNMTGTPYVNNKFISDVVYYFGLKEGIETGILKQVRFSEYTHVHSEDFIRDVTEKFWISYGDIRLEGKLPKIAFYAANIQDLRENLKPTLEKILFENKIPLNKILEYHTEAEDQKKEFHLLDTEESEKQFILLVGKGTEGWNCRSLVATALFRKPTSNIFILQSSTRCLRSIGDNSTIAHIFLSKENYGILDRELKSNFNTSMKELSAQDQLKVEHILKVQKKVKITVRKELRELMATTQKKAYELEIDISQYLKKSGGVVSEAEIYVKEGIASYTRSGESSKEAKDRVYTLYEALEILQRKTHLPCLELKSLLISLKRSTPTNYTLDYLSWLSDQITSQIFSYKEDIREYEEEIELTKNYPFKISIDKSSEKLIVYKENEEAKTGKLRLGFHINPYNFDSSDEKDIFHYMREILEKDEGIKDIYFTGGVTNEKHNEFFIEYYNPEEKRMAKYFPDFLIETTRKRFLIVEVKSTDKKPDYEQNKKQYKQTNETLTNLVYAKEVGFLEFQRLNKNFDYRIIFDTGLQKLQVVNDIKTIATI